MCFWFRFRILFCSGSGSGFCFILDLVSVPDSVSLDRVDRIWFYSSFGFGPGFGLCGLGFGSRFCSDLVSVPATNKICVVCICI